MTYQQRITCLSANDDYSLLAGGSHQTVWLWRFKPKYELIKLDGHEGWVTSVSLSGNSQYLVSSGEDNVVNVWNVQQRSLIWKNYQSQGETNAVFISDNNKLIIASSDKTIKILDISTQKVEKILKGHSKAVTCLATSPDGRLLFSGSSDKTIKIWDLKKQEYLYEIKESKTEVTCLATSFMDQKLILVSGDSDGSVNIFEINKDLKKSDFLDRFNIFKFNYKLIRSYSDFPNSIKSISFGNHKFIGFNIKEQVKYWSYNINLSGVLAHIDSVNDILINQGKDCVICATDEWFKIVDLSSKEVTFLINLKALSICSDGDQIIETENSRQFYLQATTLTEDKFNVDSIFLNWQAEGGQITSQGLFVAGGKEGNFNVIVKDKFGLLELSIPIKIIKTLPYLNKLEFSNCCDVLEFKQEFQFAVKGIDQYGQFFKIENIQWLVSHCQIDNLGRFSVDNFIGNVQVKAIARDIKNNRDIFVEKTIEIIEPAKLNQLVVYHGNENNKFYLQPGEKKVFSVTGLDQYKNPIQTGRLIWQIENISETCLQNQNNENSRILAIPENFKGEFKLIVCAVEKDVNVTINIEVPAILKQLVIEPSQNLILKPDEIQKFGVNGFDQCGDLISTNKVKWSASNNQIDKNGEFKADYINREARVSASLENVTCSVFVKILPVLNSLKVQPQISQLLVHNDQQFTVQGYDQFGDLFSLNNISWQSRHNLITSNGYFTAGSETVNDQITVSADGKCYSFWLQVYEPSYLTTLSISPAEITLSPGQSQVFKVVAKDQLDREINLDKVIWSVDKGTFKENQDDNQEILYKSSVNQKGSSSIRVTGTYQDVTKRAEANVSVPAVLRNITIYPQEISLFPDEKYQFSIVGIDQSDNRIDIDFELFPIQWKSSRGGSINASGIFKGGYSKREVNVTATVCGCSTVAKVILRPTLKKLVINPKSVSLKPDQSQQFTVEGFDQYGLAFNVRNITWEATGGTITQSGFFTANHNVKGEFSVTAIAPDYLLLPETYRKIFYALGLSGYFGSFLLSFNEDFVNQLIARILQSILVENNTGSQSKILDDGSSNILSGGLEQSGEISDFIDDPFLLWTSAKLNKLIARFLEKTGNLCLQVACANISVSAKVEIVGVPRSLQVYPSARQVSEEETFELTVEILDQYQSDCLTVKLSGTGLYEWQERDQLEAIGGKFNEKGILILNDSSSEVKEIEVIINVFYKTSEGLILENFTKIKVKKLFAQMPILQESEEKIGEPAKEDNNDSSDDDCLPVLHSIKIEPSYMKINDGEIIVFTVKGFDKAGKSVGIEHTINWESSDGKITNDGTFFAKSKDSKVIVTATIGELVAYANVEIQKKLDIILPNRHINYVYLDDEKEGYYLNNDQYNYLNEEAYIDMVFEEKYEYFYFNKTIIWLNRELWKLAKDNLDEDYENRFYVLIEIVKLAKRKIYENQNIDLALESTILGSINLDLESIVLESIEEYEC